jgi:uncharacterized protein YlxW (UPF0749 family)
MKNQFFQFYIRPLVIILFIVGIGIGFLLTVQSRTKVSRVLNPLAPFASLKDAVLDLTNQQNQLKGQIETFNQDIASLQAQVKLSQHSTNNRSDQLEALQKEAGATQLQGKGLEIILDDSPSGPITSNAIAHAADLRDLVNYLWANGVQAIAINDERIVGTTSIDCIVNTVLINNTKLVAPFKISVLGDQNYLEAKVKDKNGLKDIYERVSSEGIQFSVRKADVIIPAYKGSILIERAKVIQ